MQCASWTGSHDLALLNLNYIYLRLLQISSFNGKMNALNEVNKVLSSVSYSSPHRSYPSQADEEDWLTAEKMAVRFAFTHLFLYISPYPANSTLFFYLFGVVTCMNLLSGMDPTERCFRNCFEGQPSSASICWKTRENHSLRYQRKSLNSSRPRQNLASPGLQTPSWEKL